MTARLKIGEEVAYPRAAFADRSEAGRALARAAAPLGDEHSLVLALPRGGIPVAVPLSRSLACEMRPVAVRKLPLPNSPEMGFGAVTLDGTVTLNHAVMNAYGVTMGQAALIVEDVRTELQRRAAEYPGAEGLPVIEGRRVFIVDDGLATGYTAIATCTMVRDHNPSEVIVAVPVSPRGTIDAVAYHCDHLVCLIAQAGAGFAVASYYVSFPDLTDEEVLVMLGRPARV